MQFQPQAFTLLRGWEFSLSPPGPLPSRVVLTSRGLVQNQDSGELCAVGTSVLVAVTRHQLSSCCWSSAKTYSQYNCEMKWRIKVRKERQTVVTDLIIHQDHFLLLKYTHPAGKNIRAHHFHTLKHTYLVLFAIGKTWMQPECPLTDDWIKKMCTYLQWNTSQSWKEWNNATWSNKEGPRDYHTSK